MDLAELRDIAEKQRLARKRIRIHCCTSSGCQASRSLEIKQRLTDAVVAEGLADEAQVVSVGCMGFCGQGPMVEVDPDGTL
jgi:bidirectional [NiFe] hydrogenase diaphorase subunit